MNKIFICLLVLTLFSLQNCSKNGHKTDSSLKKFIPIAHAGGAINEHLYTNSLEALDNSYRLGCRYFELDIQLTSDNQLVAVHDWREFKEMINYDGSNLDNQALSYKDVKESRIYGKYTPLTMEMINNWFGKHQDAILITDKINDPRKIANEKVGFKFLDRCIAELFSWESIKVAKSINLNMMASSNVVFDFEKEKNRIARYLKKISIDSKLKKMNVAFIAIPHSKVAQYPKIIENIRSRGIRVCVYNVNDNNGNNEDIIYKRYFNTLIDGMYIDDVTFIKRLGSNNTQ